MGAPRSAAARRAARTGSVLALGLAVLAGCAKGPPRDPDDACAIFRERRGWWEAARASRERWGVPEAVQLAVVHQESRFRHDSRPPRGRLLWIIPWRRASSAYGYGQVTEGTWREYQRQTGHGGADRDDFRDVADFIGWYGHEIHRFARVAKDDAYNLYLAYHEGPGGYRRGTHLSKGWLLGVARRVAERARRYQAQYALCIDDLPRKRFWIF
jgi:hypothetical protein